MRFLCSFLLAVPLFAQQAPQTETVTVPIQAVAPISSLVEPNKVLIQVGDIKITARQLDILIDAYPVNTQIYVRGAGKQQFADTVVRMLVLAEEARKRKMSENDKVKQQLKFSEENVLANALNDEITRNFKIDDVTLRAYFEEHRCEYETWKVRQIVVRGAGTSSPLKPGEKVLTDAEALARAQDLRKRAADGADFAELARTESDDTTASKGGDLGTLRHGQVLPSIEEAVCRMNAGGLSEPVKTPFGYHVLKLEYKEVRPFDQLKPELDQRLRPDLVKKAIDDLIAGAKVAKDKDYYAPDQTIIEIPAPAPKKQ
jgi:parvulin-like peptidyl-prolyl isomerase